MNIGILGSGGVAQTLARALARLGHDVVLGTRHPDDQDAPKGWGALSLRAFREETRLPVLTYADAARHGALLVLAVNGLAAEAALRAAGDANLAGKTLLDLTNELDFAPDRPPSSRATDDRSLAEDLQRAFPEARVVKTLNTVTAALMVDPASLAGGDHTVFVCGDDANAKREAHDLLRALGWRDILDLGDLRAARGVEMLLPLWLRLMGTLGTPNFQFKVVRPDTTA